METTTGSPSPSSPEMALPKFSPTFAPNTLVVPPLRISMLGPTELWEPTIGFCEMGVGTPGEFGNDGYAGVAGTGEEKPVSSPSGGGGVPEFDL